MAAEKTLMIKNTDSGILTIRLSDILNCINDGERYYWTILWIDAMGDPNGFYVLEFDEEINKSPDGYILDWEELIKLSRHPNQILDLLVIGDQEKSNLHRYSSDEEMNNKCKYVLELVDSSYWLVSIKDESTIGKIKSELPGVTEYLV
ncbi:hypothetical protein [Chitinophaga tropicalis]|uniref:Uncharacterized protein n=1 Tax=Chitinophaga tropicalis TaxID=2683588 RepID=A0A7K1UD38_9BACT|nr:hypothetical protein [Chitinophaga tropicalis]MVT12284.1 hypothetical protein [Chitinophaga tropicalis]